MKQKFFLEKLPERFTWRECYELYLLVEGERPGALVMDPDSKDVELLKDFSHKFGLHFSVESSDRGLSKQGFFASREKERLEILKSEGRFYGLSDRAVGRFLGYPETSIEYFEENIGGKPIEQEVREKLSEMIEDESVDKKDAELLELVCFVPAPTRESVNEALKVAESRKERLNKKETGTKLLEKLMQNCIYSV
ncbi:MAG: hypothetical protein H8Z69_00765 [Nanohaloarchaea archaeon]|nr:hypothetical protein [Candidatus Nanohaloarchaea archaeon]